MVAVTLAGGGVPGLPLPGEPVPTVPLLSTGGWWLVGMPGSSSATQHRQVQLHLYNKTTSATHYVCLGARRLVV